MTNRERLLTVLRGEIPDCVPCAPDFSNMIPARRTGKPFWDVYLYNDPPPWKAYVDTARYFDIDSLHDGGFPLRFEEDAGNGPDWETFIVFKSPERIVTQKSYVDSGKRIWHPKVSVYYVADPPSHEIDPAKVEMGPEPARFEPLEGVKHYDRGPEGFAQYKRAMGDQGLCGAWLASSVAVYDEDGIYEYYDHPEKHEQWAVERVEKVERRFKQLMAMPVKPDFFCVGGSGTLVFQTVEIFRKLALPAVKRAIELAKTVDIPTHVHSCGPETALVEIMATETDLTVIDPLELAPMGDANLAELKKRFGHKLVLKGNLHTTETMLRGSVADVVAASKKAIDEGAAGGRFILSTGDQCGRDTPDENLFAMIETARTYGRY
jgi:uroporphyrinogen decarboxylase